MNRLFNAQNVPRGGKVVSIPVPFADTIVSMAIGNNRIVLLGKNGNVAYAPLSTLNFTVLSTNAMKGYVGKRVAYHPVFNRFYFVCSYGMYTMTGSGTSLSAISGMTGNVIYGGPVIMPDAVGVFYTYDALSYFMYSTNGTTSFASTLISTYAYYQGATDAVYSDDVFVASPLVDSLWNDRIYYNYAEDYMQESSWTHLSLYDSNINRLGITKIAAGLNKNFAAIIRDHGSADSYLMYHKIDFETPFTNWDKYSGAVFGNPSAVFHNGSFWLVVAEGGARVSKATDLASPSALTIPGFPTSGTIEAIANSGARHFFGGDILCYTDLEM